MKHKVKIGDVFAIPIGGQYAFGQVIAESKPKCYIVFDLLSTQIDNCLLNEYVEQGKATILTFTMDECVRDGVWPYLFNALPSGQIRMPNYKIESLDGVYLTDYSGKKLRLATKEEALALEYREFITPYVLEKLVSYHFGVVNELNKYEAEAYNFVLYSGKTI